MDEQEYDPARFQAIEEATYHTSAALEALLNILVEKGVLTEQELIEKMDGLAMQEEDVEELGHDANAPREQDE